MIARLFRWFETLIDAFAAASAGRCRRLRFGGSIWHFRGPFWPPSWRRRFWSAAIALIEVSLFAFVGSLVDLMPAARSPPTSCRPRAYLVFMAVVVRSSGRWCRSSTISSSTRCSAVFATLIRWQTHAYVLRQSLAFFQNDFAGRVATKIMQSALAVREVVVKVIDALWYVAIYLTARCSCSRRPTCGCRRR